MTADTQAPALRTPLAAAALARVRPWLWLVGWWAVGRVVTIATAMTIHATVWELGIWDGRWYRMVARFGYLLVPGRQSDPAFFPFYSILLRGLHGIGIGYGYGGPLLSNLGLLATLVVFHALTREVAGEGIARRATIYVAIFPFGYVFSMTYPESLVLGMVAGAALAARRGRWWLAGLLGVAAALSRPEGMFVALPLAGIAWSRRHELRPGRRGVVLGAVLAPVVGLASYPVYLAGAAHNLHAWQQAQKGWNRHFEPLGFVHAIQHLPVAVHNNHWLLRDVVALCLYLVLLGIAWYAGLPRLWILAGVAIVALPPFSGAFDSISRFGLLVPPIFWALAVLGRNRVADWSLRVLSLALLVGAVLSLPYQFP